MAASWRIVTRDRQRIRHGDLALAAYATATFELRYNDESSWSVDGIPFGWAGTSVLDFEHVGTQTGGDQGILLLRDNEVLLSGPIRHVDLEDGERGILVSCSGIDDTGLLADRPILPDPAGLDFTIASYDEVGPIAAEGALRHYVQRHAISNRAIPGLYLGAYSALGTPTTKKKRLDNLLAVLQEIALGAGLRFRIYQTGPGLREFVVDQPADLRTRVRFDRVRGTLRDGTRSEDAPTANRIYVFGSGELEGQIVAVREDAASITKYGLIEGVSTQRQTDDLTELGNKLTEELLAGAAVVSVTMDPIEGDGAEYGVDYRLGDQVTATIQGYTVAGYVSSVQIVLDAKGATITPTITTKGIAKSSRSRARIVGQRIASLEANTASAGSMVDVNSSIDDLAAAINTLDGEVDAIQAPGGVSATMLAAGAALANLASGSVGAVKLAVGAALSNLGYTPARIASGSYTGDGTTPRTISIGFTPVWVQVTIGGAGAGIQMYMGDGNRIVIEDTSNNIQILTGGFVAGGFQVRDDAKSNNATATTYQYVATG